jgi:excisionase family DNA binding protein
MNPLILYCVYINDDQHMSKAFKTRKGFLNMPILLNHNTFYRTSEAADIAGISRSTLLRWIKEGLLGDASYRDRRGWRLFTKKDIYRIKAEANSMENAE